MESLPLLKEWMVLRREEEDVVDERVPMMVEYDGKRRVRSRVSRIVVSLDLVKTRTPRGLLVGASAKVAEESSSGESEESSSELSDSLGEGERFSSAAAGDNMFSLWRSSVRYNGFRFSSALTADSTSRSGRIWAWDCERLAIIQSNCKTEIRAWIQGFMAPGFI